MSTIMNSVTNVAIAAQCGFAWRRLRATGPAVRGWSCFFGALTGAAMAGAVRHAVADGTPVMVGALLLVDAAIGVMVLAAQRASLAWQRPRWRRPLHNLFLVQAGAFWATAISRHDFAPALAHAVVGLGYVLGSALVAARRGSRAARATAQGLLVGLVAAVAYLARLGPASWFDHVDVAHVLAMLAVVLLYRAARLEAVKAAGGPWRWDSRRPRTAGAAVTLALLFVPPAAAGDSVSRCEPVAPGECVQVTLEGAGSDVVLIPGLFGASFGFRRLVPLLVAEGNRVIVIEPLGVGFSARPPKADYSLTAQAGRIAAALDQLGVSSAVVVSHSVAGSMALRLALIDPDRVRAIVSLEGGPVEEVTTAGFRRAMKLAPILKLFGAGRMIRGRVKGMLESRSGDRSWVTEAVVDGYVAGPSRDVGATLDAFAQMARAREPERLAPRLAEVRCPVRLVLGEAPHDGAPTAAEIELLTRLLPRFAVIRVPAVGNFLFEEAPRAVADIVRELAMAHPSARAADRP